MDENVLISPENSSNQKYTRVFDKENFTLT